MTDTDRIAQMAREAGFDTNGGEITAPHHGDFGEPMDVTTQIEALVRLVAEDCLANEDAIAELMAEHLYGHPRLDAIEWAKEDKFDSEKDKALALIAFMRGAIRARYSKEG